MAINFLVADSKRVEIPQTVEHANSVSETVIGPSSFRVEAEAPHMGEHAGLVNVSYGNLSGGATGWETAASSKCSGGRIKYSDNINDFVEITFYGTGITVIALKSDYWGGISEIFLDDVSEGYIDFYNSTDLYQQNVFSILNINPGLHTLKIQNTGTKNPSSSGYRIYFDAIDIIGSTQKTVDNQGSTESPATVAITPVERKYWINYLGAEDPALNPPHRILLTQGNTDPGLNDTWYTLSTNLYPKYSILDGVGYLAEATTNDYYRYIRFDFDLSNLNKDYFTEITFDWYGYVEGQNSGVADYTANIYAINITTGSYDLLGYIDTGGIITYTSFTINQNINDYIDNDGVIHFVIRSKYPSDGVGNSKNYTDYAQLSVKHCYAKLGSETIINKGKNLVKNGGFETGDDTNWYDGLLVSSEDSYNGSYSAKVTYSFPFQNIDVLPNTTYTFSAYGKNGAGVPIRAYVRVKNKNLEWTQSFNIYWSETEWTKKTLTFTTASEDIQVVIFLTKHSGDNNYDTNYGYIDNVQLEVGDTDTDFSNDPDQSIGFTTPIELGSGGSLKVDSTRKRVAANGQLIDVENVEIIGKELIKLYQGKNTIQFTDDTGSGQYYTVKIDY